VTLKVGKPTTASRRLRSVIVYDVDKKGPEKSLIAPLKGSVGRAHGTVSVRHRKRGAKKYLRIVDFKRDKKNIPAVVSSIEYDPTHGPNVALLFYKDGEKRYILAPQGLKKGDVVVSGEDADLSAGNSLPLSKVPGGTQVHNIEFFPGKGGQLVRGAGCFATVMSSDDKFVTLKMPSGEIRKFLGKCYATIGSLANDDRKSMSLGKAGRKIHMGIRPTVRGVAMPWKHPHAGSYKTSGVGRKAPLSPWGWNTKGKKTRKRKKVNVHILQRRRSK